MRCPRRPQPASHRNRQLLLGLGLAAGLLGLPLAAGAQCLPDPAVSGETVTCTGLDADGFDAGTAQGLMVDVRPGAEVRDAAPGGAALRLHNTNLVIIAPADGVDPAGQVSVSGAGSLGVRVQDGNTLSNGGLLAVGGADATGLSANTSNAITNRGVLDLSGLRAVGIEILGPNNNVDNVAGAIIRVSGNDAVGVRVSDMGAASARVRNLGGGRIEVTGAAATGIGVAGGGSVISGGVIAVGGDGARGVEVDAGIAVDLNAGAVVEVTGTNALGIGMTGEGNTIRLFVGSLVDASGDNATGIVGAGGNSLTISGTVEATGTGSVGIELAASGAGTDNSLTNSGVLRATSAAAAALRFTGGGTGESFLSNVSLGRIDAPDTTAIDGSDSVEHVINQGSIRGAVMLRAGDDSFRQAGNGTLEGVLDAGLGLDALELLGATLELGTVSNFETLSVLGSAQPAPRRVSTLRGSASFADGIEVEGNAGLRVEGTVGLTGSYTQRSDGALHVQLFQTGGPVPGLSSDRLSVVGNATLEDGSILDVELVDPAAPHPLPEGVVTVLDASGGVSVTLGELLLQGLPTESAVLSFAPQLDATGQELQVAVSREAYAGFGSGNGARMGAYLDGLLPGASGSVAELLAGLDQLGPASLAGGLETLHPEIYDASTSTALATGLEFTRRLHRRPVECGILALPERPEVESLSTCGELGIAPWLDLAGIGATRDGGSSHVDYHHFGALAALGIDARPAEGWLVSGSFGGSHHWIESDDASGSLATIDLGASVSAELGPLRVRGAASYGRGFHQLDRQVQLGAGRVQLEGDWESDRVTLLGSVAWPLVVWNWDLAPELQLDYAHLFEEAVSESGGSPSLAVDDRDNGILGVGGLIRASGSNLWLGSLSRVPEWWHGTFTRSFHLGVRGVVSGADRDLDARLRSGGAGSAVQVGASDAAWLVRAGLGLGFQPWASAASLTASYAVDIGDGTLLQQVELRLHVPF